MLSLVEIKFPEIQIDFNIFCNNFAKFNGNIIKISTKNVRNLPLVDLQNAAKQVFESKNLCRYGRERI
jgi:hypothetical protein